MKSKIIITAIFLLLVQSCFATVTINFETDYGAKNFLLLCFLIAMFLVDLIIYIKLDDIDYSSKNLLKTLTSLILKFLCWAWFVIILYTSQSILFISSSSDFLINKIQFLYRALVPTIVLLLIIGTLNAFKFYNKISGTENFVKSLINEIKTGGER